MGRHKKYHTEDEKKVANNTKVKEFYWNNKRQLDLEASIRYWRKKLSKLEVDGIDLLHPIYVKAKSKLDVLVTERELIIQKKKTFIPNNN